MFAFFKIFFGQEQKTCYINHKRSFYFLQGTQKSGRKPTQETTGNAGKTVLF